MRKFHATIFLLFIIGLQGCVNSTYSNNQAMRSELTKSKFTFSKNELSSAFKLIDALYKKEYRIKVRVGDEIKDALKLFRKLRSINLSKNDMSIDKQLEDNIVLEVYHVKVPKCQEFTLDSYNDAFGCSLESNLNQQIANPDNIYR